ncbi:MAG TPA: hypothetical protein VGQ56_19210, partial [Gemmatimonadaceae bacterium]|nr:hypothetical protein [Gemmatimonadaceae bacterium]
MARYPSVQYWGIWNEPNDAFLTPDPGQTRFATYERIFDGIAGIIRTNGRKVIAPELANNGTDPLSGTSQLQWLSDFLRDRGSQVNVVAV